LKSLTSLAKEIFTYAPTDVTPEKEKNQRSHFVDSVAISRSNAHSVQMFKNILVVPSEGVTVNIFRFLVSGRAKYLKADPELKVN
jgi:hypothetical protein